MKEYIEYLIKHLVEKPEEIHINEIVGNSTVLLELHVGDGDMGKVIGRRGQTARSLRTLLTASTAKQGKRYILEILDNRKEKTVLPPEKIVNHLSLTSSTNFKTERK